MKTLVLALALISVGQASDLPRTNNGNDYQRIRTISILQSKPCHYFRNNGDVLAAFLLDVKSLEMDNGDVLYKDDLINVVKTDEPESSGGIKTPPPNTIRHPMDK